MTIRLVTCVTLLLAATLTAAQPQRPRPAPPRDRAQAELQRGTAVLRGNVVAADTGSPIRRAQVRVAGPGASSRLATTDAQGRYEVRDLPAGRYTVSASKGGFVSLQYGQRRPSESGTPIEIGDGQLMDKVVIALPRGSVISGRISDEFGEPVANAVVSAMRYAYSGGALRLVAGGSQNSRDTTDDQGYYRLFGLSPGDYIVSASFRAGGEALDPAGENTGYAATYYPGTTSVAEAQRVSVGLGQEHNSVVFALIATRLVRVTGAVVDSQGAPVNDGNVLLVSSGGRVSGPMPMTNFGGRIDANGQFRIMNVPPGRYTAQVRAGRGRGNGAVLGEFGRQDITVGAQDLDGVMIVTAPGARILGSVTTERTSTASLRPQEVSVATRAVQVDASLPPGNSNARLNNDWSFEINGVFEPRVFRVNTPQGWVLKSVLLNGEDITDLPLDAAPGSTVSGVQIVLTDRVTEVNGRIADARNAPITDATVVVFPADEQKWIYQSRYIRAARPDQDGRFQVRGLPAYDDYVAIAVQGLEDGQAGDPEFLATIRDRGTKLSLKEGEAKTLDLRVASR
jgi:protocatechuate 3,4-dioxygenase beta subunit